MITGYDYLIGKIMKTEKRETERIDDFNTDTDSGAGEDIGRANDRESLLASRGYSGSSNLFYNHT